MAIPTCHTGYRVFWSNNRRLVAGWSHTLSRMVGFPGSATHHHLVCNLTKDTFFCLVMNSLWIVESQNLFPFIFLRPLLLEPTITIPATAISITHQSSSQMMHAWYMAVFRIRVENSFCKISIMPNKASIVLKIMRWHKNPFRVSVLLLPCDDHSSSSVSVSFFL